jgi:hypothetical protein
MYLHGTASSWPTTSARPVIANLGRHRPAVHSSIGPPSVGSETPRSNSGPYHGDGLFQSEGAFVVPSAGTDGSSWTDVGPLAERHGTMAARPSGTSARGMGNQWGTFVIAWSRQWRQWATGLARDDRVSLQPRWDHDLAIIRLHDTLIRRRGYPRRRHDLAHASHYPNALAGPGRSGRDVRHRDQPWVHRIMTQVVLSVRSVPGRRATGILSPATPSRCSRPAQLITLFLSTGWTPSVVGQWLAARDQRCCCAE